MTIIVTGGAGFIGSNFILNTIRFSNEIIVNLDKLTYAGNLENLKSIKDNKNYIFLKGCIGDEGMVNKILHSYKPRAIINFAAETHVDRSIHSPEVFIDTNIRATFNLLQCTYKYWSNLSFSDKSIFRFLHVSTDEVYGALDKKDPPFSEDNPYKPNSPYSASKASSDLIVRSFFHTYDFPTLTTNCSNNYGPYQFPEKLIPLVICNAISDQKLPIYGNGHQIRDWLHVNDHCDALWQVLSNGNIGEVYNIGGKSEMNNLQVVTLICEVLNYLRPRKDGKSYKDQIEFVPDRPGHDTRYAINISKINKELNWSPKETFATGLIKTIEWYLDNPAWITNLKSGSYQEWIQKNYDYRNI